MDEDVSDSEETAPFLGTLLDPKPADSETPADRRRARPVPIHEQRVLDERGRPLRFHGAFTGGFSAGHFNTVADEAGFTPGTFVSRRRKHGTTEEVARKRQRPEDFMDAEDFGEFGIAPRTLHAGVDYADPGNKTSTELVRDMVCPIRPLRLPIAVKLMRRFGWREGQGVGERSGEQEADDDLLFASPDDIPHIRFLVKTNTFGIGYSGIDPRTALFQPPSRKNDVHQSVAVGASRRGIRGQAFGVSALEEDDDDIFAGDDMSKYDWAIGGPSREEEDLHGWTAPTAKKKNKKPMGYVGKLLSGFRLSETSQNSARDRFPPLFLPAWFVPVRGANGDLLQQPGEVETHEAGPGASIFDFISREDRLRLQRARERLTTTTEPPRDILKNEGVLLTDIRHPCVKTEQRTSRRSRWDRMLGEPEPSESREKTSEVKGRPGASSEVKERPGATSEVKERPGATSEVKERPGATSEVKGRPGATSEVKERPGATSEVKGRPGATSEVKERPGATSEVKPLPHLKSFQPFSDDAEKNARFLKFRALANKATTNKAYAMVGPKHFTEWERQKEEEEFVQALRASKPLAGVLASRFHRGDDIALGSPQEEGRNETAAREPASEKERAAEEKRYGPLTRRGLKWHPHPLVCRRFNVPEPYPESDIVGLEEKARQRREGFATFDFLSLMAEAVGDRQAATEPRRPELQPPDPKTKKKKKSVFSVLLDDKTSTELSSGPQSTVTSSGPPSTMTSSDPQSTMTSSDPQSTVTSSGPTSTVTSSDPQSTVTSSGPPSTMTSISGPQSSVTSSGPQSTVTSSDPPSTVTSSGPPSTVMSISGPQSSVTSISGPQSSVTSISGPQSSVTSISGPQSSVTSICGPQSSVTSISGPQSSVTSISGPQSSVTSISGPQSSVTSISGPQSSVTSISGPQSSVTSISGPQSSVTSITGPQSSVTSISGPQSSVTSISGPQSSVTSISGPQSGTTPAVKEEALESLNGDAQEVEEKQIPIDIFKAIFADSESSDDDVEEEKDVEVPAPVAPASATPNDRPEGKKAEDAPSKTVAVSNLFRHLFEEEKPAAEASPPPSRDRTQEGADYGPALPPDLPSTSESLSCNEFLLRVAARDFVEDDRSLSKSRDKKRKSKKSHKTKKSKKKKKHRKHSSSSECS